MNNRKTIGVVLLVAGMLILIVSLTSDMFGIGADVGTFGTKQIIGVVAGIIAAAVGFVLMRMRKPA